ncbi:MAG: hypothetical protein ABL994_18430, partial [Verrucomicrobiales bacterium]
DYYRPGGLLTSAARMALADPERSISYAREDLLCPSTDLLKKFRVNTEMAFCEYAQKYATELSTSGAIELAAAHLILNLARGFVSIYYCVDPHIPGYTLWDEVANKVPYEERTYPLKELRYEGCHRVILAEEIARFFTKKDIRVNLLELEPTFERVGARLLE